MRCASGRASRRCALVHSWGRYDAVPPEAGRCAARPERSWNSGTDRLSTHGHPGGRHHEHPHSLLAPARRRPRAVRRVPARLQAARGPARRVLRAPAREHDQMVLTTYGRSSGFCVDPIEKKPLNHFLPGTSVLSFGTAGCNLACRFCQNWDISKSREIDTLADQAAPETIAARRGAPRLPQRRVHLQRPGDLPRVRDGRRRRLPRARHHDRRGHGRLHVRRAAARVLRADGRGQRRPQGVHRRVLPPRQRRPRSSPCSTRSSTSCTRPTCGSRSRRC